MANHSEKVDSDQQEWDMEFKDPFSLEEDELVVYCSGNISQPHVVTTASLSVGQLAVETLNDVLVQRVITVVSSSFQTISHNDKPATPGFKLPNCKENFKKHQSELEVTACLSTTVSVDESKTTEHMNESVTPCSDKLSRDTKIESSCNEAEEQSPIPVMLSSAKRFCASEDIEKSQVTKQGGAYFRLPSPSAVLSNSRCFAQPAYPQSAYNVPAWPAGSLPVSDGGTAVQIPPVVHYNNCVPYSAILSHPTSIPMLYSQSPIPVVDGTGNAEWPESQLQLQSILSKPPPPVPGISHTAILGLPAHNFAVHTPQVPHLQNGLTAHRLTLSTVPQVVPAYLTPNVSIAMSSHSVVLPNQQCQPHNTISGLAKSGLPVVNIVSLSASHSMLQCDAVLAQQPMPLSTNAHASICLSSTLPVCSTEFNNNKHLMPNDKRLLPSEQLRYTQPVTKVLSPTVACTGLSVSNLCPPLTSSGFASKQTVTLPLSCSNIPQMKCTSPFAQLDPRLHNGRRQNVGSASQIPSTANAASAFVVPVPPPLPSLEELTAECSNDSQKNDKAVTAGVTSQSTTSGSTTTDSDKLDRVRSGSNCDLVFKL